MASSLHCRRDPLAILIIGFAMMLVFGAASAAELILQAENGSGEPVWTVLEQTPERILLEVLIPSISDQTTDNEGRAWSALDLGGGLFGKDGEPGFPTISRLVSVPAGATVSGRILESDMVALPDLDLLPVQPADGSGFVMKTEAYTRDRWLKAVGGRAATALTSDEDDTPAVFVGQPAVIAGRTVTALTVAPVVINPHQHRALAARRVLVELTFHGGRPDATRRTPPSFASTFEAVLGADVAAEKAGAAAPGTWMLFYRDDSVETRLLPLIDWRRRQGYHVELRKTDVTGNTTTAIKSQIQAVYNDPALPPLEFVVLAGDAGGTYAIPTYNESLTGYGGEGDHPYTLLDGSDILADIHIGRLSFNNPTQLTTIVNKIVGYETAPPTADPSWFGRAHLIGDPSQSGATTIYVNRWLRTQLQNNGWAQVDTTWSGNFSSQMMSRVGAGVSAFGYRGYYGMSGISNGHVANLANGGMLPVAIIPTCDTGTFESQGECMSEAWLRSAGGAVAAVGTATIGTHTRYNNCYYHGTWDGLLNGADHRVGVAHSLGKVELYTNYFLAEPNIVEIWSIWNNLMGDPATDMWTGAPTSPAVSHLSALAVGTGVVVVDVTVAGLPREGARVCVDRDGEVQSAGFTDAAGTVALSTSPLTAGDLILTVSGHGLLPYQATVTVGDTAGFCSPTDHQVDGDGLASPGETVALQAALTNFGTGTVAGVSAVLGATTGVTLTDNSLDFGTIAPGAEVWSSDTATLELGPTLADGTVLRLPLTAGEGVLDWASLLELSVSAPAFSVEGTAWSGPGGDLDPGETGSLTATLRNVGSLDASGVTATLTTGSPWVTITGSPASFDAMTAGATGGNAATPFGLELHPQCYPGHLAVFTLTVTSNGGMIAVTDFAMTVGSIATDSPTGPDAYGYSAYDDTDVGSGLAPVYDWVALDPDHGGPGVDLGLTDGGWEQDDTATIDLPFTFRYYGADYTRLSICSNGWAAMGECSMVNYRNFSIPSKGSPPAMLAPFWDNLSQTGTHRVYTWHDTVNHRFIVQWYRMPNDFSNLEQNFEMILLDPAWHGTATGDGMIVFQYETVNNTDTRDGYATVGLQDLERDGGLLWTYWNQYAAGAAPLASGRAIRFVPLGQPLLPTADVTPASITQSVAVGGQVVEHVHIANTGEAGSDLRFDVTVIDPATLSALKRNITGSIFTISATDYLPGTTVDLSVSATCFSPDQEWIIGVSLDAPPGVTINSASNLIGGSSPLGWNGQTGDGAVTTWGDGGPGGGFIDNGQKADATVNVTFGAQASGDLTFHWTLDGDQWGATPHQTAGDIVLAMQGPSITVNAPAAGVTAVLGSDLEVAFQAFNGPVDVDIAVQRADGGPWTPLAAGVPVGSGTWTWTVTGEPGPYARIRVSDAADAAVFGTSGVFAMGRPMDWIQLAASSGAVAAGQSMTLDVTLDATTLAEGVHDGLLMVTTNGGAPVSVPVGLTVTGATAVDEPLPRATSLLGNHPNPFNPSTVISFALAADQEIDLKIYSSRGRLVRSLLSGPQTAGVHHVVWDGRDADGRAVASGAYLYRLQHAAGSMSGKMVLTK